MVRVLPISELSNRALLDQALQLAANQRAGDVSLIVTLREIDSRRLYLSEGHSCMFHYCTNTLRLSESAAYSRIEAARISRAFPQVLDALTSGALNLTTAVLIAPHLTPGNVDDLIAAASFKKKVEVQQLIAGLHPKPDVPTVVRKQPETRRSSVSGGDEPALTLVSADAPLEATAGSEPAPAPPTAAAASPARPATIAPLSATRYKIQFTADQETHDKLRRAQALLRHQIPHGDVAAVVNKALTLLIADVERKKLGLVARPRSASRTPAEGSRHIPAAVRREVSARDGGQCAFVGVRGRCDELERLEFHHVVPFAAGGTATVDNIQLRCRAHNAHEAVLYFGEDALPGRARQRPR
jgi:hypothetical protein